MVSDQNNVQATLSRIQNQLRNEIEPLLNNSDENGHYAVPLIIFSFIELLAILRFNPVEEEKNGKQRKFFKDSHTKVAMKYIRIYLGEVRPEYKKYVNLLYELYRHPLSHCYDPAEIAWWSRRKGMNLKLSWAIEKGVSKKKVRHLVLSYARNRGYCILTINTNTFYNDLMSSIDKLKSTAIQTKEIQKNIIEADRKLSSPKTRKSLGRGAKRELLKLVQEL